MSESRIIQLINSPELLEFSDETYIARELEKYPFVQSFHYLYLKWKLSYTKEDCTDSIEKLSIYSTHRELIKEIVDHTEKKVLKFADHTDKEDWAQENNLESTTLEENSKKEIENKISEEENKVTTDEMKTESAENKFTDLENHHNKNLINNFEEENYIKLAQEEKNKKGQININKLGLSYLFTPEDDETKYDQSLKEIKNVSDIKKEDLQIESECIDLDTSESSYMSKNHVSTELGNQYIQEDDKGKEEKEQHKSSIINITTSGEKLTFNQWLSFSKHSLDNKDDKKTDTDTSNKKNQKNVIEKFIENNPKITPPKKGGKSKQEFDFKKEEIKDIANLMTITLAQLYVEQGRYDTAITAYKILSLKYPEKSSYFALEIKKIKKLKN